MAFALPFAEALPCDARAFGFAALLLDELLLLDDPPAGARFGALPTEDLLPFDGDFHFHFAFPVALAALPVDFRTDFIGLLLFIGLFFGVALAPCLLRARS